MDEALQSFAESTEVAVGASKMTLATKRDQGPPPTEHVELVAEPEIIATMVTTLGDDDDGGRELLGKSIDNTETRGTE